MRGAAVLDHEALAALIPHKYAMCLLDSAETWSAGSILCRAMSHLSEENPLRRDGRLGTICGCEYGFQAMALHGALTAGGVAQPAGYLVGLRVGFIGPAFLDDPEFGALRVEATREAADPSGLIYGFRLSSCAGDLLLSGRATIKLPAMMGAAP